MLLAAIALSGCLPPQAGYSLGLGTGHVSGTLRLAQPVGAESPTDPAAQANKTAPPSAPVPPTDGAAPGDDALIVVYRYHHTFITLSDGARVHRPSAQVVKPRRDGAFSIAMPNDVVEMRLLFIAPGYLTEVFNLRRQVGVGDVDYRAQLVPMHDWRNHYYAYLNPQLQQLITEERFNLEPREQQWLADWLAARNNDFAAPPGAPGAARSQ